MAGAEIRTLGLVLGNVVLHENVILSLVTINLEEPVNERASKVSQSTVGFPLH